MVWLAISISTFLCLLPSCLHLLFAPNIKQPKKIDALNFFKEQLKSLELDLNQNLITLETYEQRKIEYQKSLLKSLETCPLECYETRPKKAKILLFILGVFIPFSSLILYCVNGNPQLPAQPLKPRLVEQEKLSAQLYPYLNDLKKKLAVLSLNNPKRYQGYVLLGQLEASQGNLHASVLAWKQALLQKFDPELAAQTAEFQCRYDHKVSQESADLFLDALKKAPQDAPWKEIAQHRLAEFYQNNNP